MAIESGHLESIDGAQPQEAVFSLMPVVADLPRSVVRRRLHALGNFPSGRYGLIGVRLTDLDASPPAPPELVPDEPLTLADDLQSGTELIYALRAWSRARKTCACCRQVINHQTAHVLFSPPPDGPYPYHHLHRPCFDTVLAGLVSVDRVPRIAAQQGVEEYAQSARQNAARSAASQIQNTPLG